MYNQNTTGTVLASLRFFQSLRLVKAAKPSGKRPEVERFLCYSNHNASIGSKISAAESFFSSK